MYFLQERHAKNTQTGIENYLKGTWINFLLSWLSLLETDYKCDDYGRDSSYRKHCNESAFDKNHHALTDYPKFCIGMPAVRTDGWSVSRAVYGQVIAKFSRMGRFTYIVAMGLRKRARGAPLLQQRETTIATKISKEEVDVH